LVNNVWLTIHNYWMKANALLSGKLSQQAGVMGSRGDREPLPAPRRPIVMKRSMLVISVALLFAFAATPARATCGHEYVGGEYAIIRDGLSPDKRMSLASHGEGELGHENFHVWLMAEPSPPQGRRPRRYRLGE